MATERESELTTAISGSFKFKPEIDEVHEEFRDYGVVVIAPDTGWLYLPKFRLAVPGDSDFSFRPLPSERQMGGAGEIERMFLRDIRTADFVYFYTPEGYAGNSVAFEFGFALALEKPLYALEPLADTDDPEARNFHELFNAKVTVLPIAEVAADFRKRQATSEDQG
jgi:hypothetical protein